MTIKVSKDTQQKSITISVQGEFVFSQQRDFRDAYRDEPSDYHYIIDLGQASYMDSSALGMLLMLWEHVNKDRSKMSIIHASGTIRDILAIANFNNYLDIR